MDAVEHPIDMRSRPSISTRITAALAIACLLAALVVAAFAVRETHVWRVAVGVLSVAVSIQGAWYVLASRRWRRIFGLIAALAGLVTFVTIALTGANNGILVAIAILLIAASSLASRRALATPTRDDSVTAGPVRHQPRLRHPALIMNRKSGGGKVDRYDLPERCRVMGIDTVVLRPGDDLNQLAEDAIARGADVIGMAGGDGSQAQVAAVAARHDVPFVCVPAGTRNHLALDLGIDRDDLVGALDAFFGDTERRVDLATANGKVFVNNASMGLYAKVVQSPAYRNAKLKTAADMLPDLLGTGQSPFDLRFSTPKGIEWPFAHMLLVSNNAYQLDSVLGGGKRPRLDSGRLGIAAARVDGPRAAVTFIGLEAAGLIRTFAGWEEWEETSFVVHSGSPIEVGLDGEAMQVDPPLVFASMPGALRVRLPINAKQDWSTEAHHLSPEMISSLLAVAAGRA